MVTLRGVRLDCFFCCENEATRRHSWSRGGREPTTLAWAVVLTGVTPATFRVSPATAKRERAASWECAGTIPSWHGLLGLCERGAGPQTAPLASPRVLQRGGADRVPELSNSFCPVRTGGCDLDRMGSDVSERGWCRGVRVRAVAPGGAAGASPLSPLCSLEGAQTLPPG